MLKADFKNIGPISEASLELGDLTVVAGQNNTGKTYLAYTLYGFLKFIEDNASVMRVDGRFDEWMVGLARAAVKRQSISIDIEKYNDHKKLKEAEEERWFSSREIYKIFSTDKNQFHNVSCKIRIKGSEDKFKQKINSPLYSLESQKRGDALIIELNINKENYRLPSIYRGMHLLFARIMNRSFPDTFILSAERFGISLFYKELDFTRNRLVEHLQKLSKEKGTKKGSRGVPFHFIERESARYAKPIADNIDFTRDLLNVVKSREGAGIQDRVRSVGSIMESDYKIENDEIKFVSKKRGANRFDIPLHLASSSARGLSDLYFYLKYVAEPGQLLMIDEPESHLSPTNQILMARLVAFCVNSGLQVLITTHSDYIIKELNNLIMLHGEFEGKADFLKRNKKDYGENDSLNYEKIRAYVCENGTLTKCAIDADGIDMPVFDDAIDKINKISNELGLLKIKEDE